MAKSTHPPVNSIGPAREYSASNTASATIFVQGDAATSVMYVEEAACACRSYRTRAKRPSLRCSMGAISSARGCLAGQPQRMATATAMAPCTIVAVDKQDMLRHLHARPAFADRFLTHMLTRNIRIEEDLIDQLFNSTEKRLARTLLLLTRVR